MNKNQGQCCTKIHKAMSEATFKMSPCPCKCHCIKGLTFPSAPTVEGWEKEFDEAFHVEGAEVHGSANAVKDFIRKTLSHSRTQVIESIEAEVDKLTKYGTTEYTGNEWAYLETEIRQLLTQLKKGE